jgi:hypothetical protein
LADLPQIFSILSDLKCYIRAPSQALQIIATEQHTRNFLGV